MKVRVVVKVVVQGADGRVVGESTVTLPCMPFEGLAIDGLDVLRSDWNTALEAWTLTVQGYHQAHGDARQNFAKHVRRPEEWKMEFTPTTKPSGATTGA